MTVSTTSPLSLPTSPLSPKSPRSLSFPFVARSPTQPRTITLHRSLLTRDVLDDLTVPKNRRPRFELTLTIHDLNNIPLTTGTCYVKHSISSKHHSVTPRAPVKDHKVSWNQSTQCQVRMTIDRTGLLQETNLTMQVVQELEEERMLLGVVTLNLAEYAGVESETRRYLMQDSKVNSTLKVTVALVQVSGDTTFRVPRLKSAHIFGAITGVINDQAPTDSSVGSHEASDHNSTNRITLEHLHYTTSLQDMYRETLTSQWQPHADELNADECIEDIFSGGTGWKSSSTSPDPTAIKATHHRTTSHTRPEPSADSSSSRRASSEDQPPSPTSTTSTTSLKSTHSHPRRAPATRSSSTTSHSSRHHSGFNDSPTSIFAPRMGLGANGAGQASRWREQVVERKVVSRTASRVGGLGLVRGREVDEEGLGEDLRSWGVGK